MFPSEFQGFAVAVFNFTSSCGGSLATLTLGALKTHFSNPDDADWNHALNGYLLACGVCLSYIICGPLFIVSGVKYSNQMKKVKAKLIEDEKTAANKPKEVQADIEIPIREPAQLIV